MNRLFALLVAALITGCGDEGSDPRSESVEPSLPGVYTGVFPCDGCPGINATLWLRSDRRFFFRQQYPADDKREAMTAYGLGRWIYSAADHAIELIGSGPVRTIVRMDQNTIILETDSDREHRLTRKATATNFDATIRMAGIVRMRDGSATFTECLTGLVAPISTGGDVGRMRHQLRSAGGRSGPTYVEFEGRFSWLRDGTVQSLTIERFGTVKSNRGC